MEYSNPSNIFGISALIEDDDIDIKDLEAEITGAKKPEPTKAISEFQPYDSGARRADPLVNRYAAPKVMADSDDEEDDIREHVKQSIDKDIKKASRYEEEDDEDEDEDDENALSKNMMESRITRTNEEIKNAAVQRVMKGMRQINYLDLQKEHDDDEKTVLLEEIDMLCSILREDNIDYSNIKLPTEESSIEDMLKTRKRLQIRNDRNRCRTFGEEIFTAIAYGFESIFDGEKEYFGRRPDLTDWNTTVGVKLRRMRYDTSSMVSTVMRDNNFGPMARIAMELIPSMVIHSKTRKTINNRGDLYSSSEMRTTIDRIRDMNDKR